MISPPPTDQVSDGETPTPDLEKLCSILLEVAGRDTNRLPSVRRHVAALDRALPFMTKEQAAIALARIRHHEDRWGSLLGEAQEGSETDGIPPETRLAGWLSLRRYPARYLNLLHEAAKACRAGETSLSRIMALAYRHEIDGVLPYVSLDSFREWLIQLRIAYRAAPGVYLPGQHCMWWVDEMHPETGTAYAACLKRYGFRVRRRS